MSLSPRTIEHYIYNIMSKLGCNSRDGIIDFIEKSKTLHLLKNHYCSLLAYQAFEKIIQELSVFTSKMPHKNLVIQGEDEKYFLKQLQSDLRKTGSSVASTASVDQINNIVIMLPGKESNNQSTYYDFFFTVIKKAYPDINIDKYINIFKEFCDSLLLSGSSVLTAQEHVKIKKHLDLVILWSSLIIFLFIGASYALMKGQSSTDISYNPKMFIRPDLAIPLDPLLLNRSQILAQIAKQLSGKSNIQTVALIGIGGAGKTTLARQYLQAQKSSIIWEINAETKECLQRSFESLAYALCQTEEDKRILRELQGIKDLTEKQEEIIHFVSDRLRALPDWFLSFDNVEKFSDIQNYFPRDPKQWGRGKIILTTRDGNILNNMHVQKTIHIQELDVEEKLTLFNAILSEGKSPSIEMTQDKERKEFLNQIPSFPLDVSMAAYYLKSTNISFREYLENLRNIDEVFIGTQENILQEATGYAKTRYRIITLSLQNLIDAHKNFIDLLLFISLLDSQRIPRDLLNTYKSPAIVDKFIYYLKKYSLITNESNQQNVGADFSIHRSTQEISLSYLTKALNLTEDKKILQPILSILDKYLIDFTDNLNLETIRILATHCESLLKHNILLIDPLRSSIKGKLGAIYYELGNEKSAYKLLEDSFTELTQSKNDHFKSLAWVMIYLGDMYRYSGDYKKAKDLLEKCLVLYNQRYPEGNLEIAWLLLHLGNAEDELGNYEKAKSYEEGALQSFKNQFSGNEIRCALALMNLLRIHNQLGHYDKAKALAEEGLSILKPFENHLVVGWLLGELGETYRYLGEYSTAKALIEQSRDIMYKQQFFSSPIRGAWTLHFLGNTYAALGDYQKARILLQKCLVIYTKYYGENHVKTARILRDLGNLDLLENNLENAGKLINKALNIFAMNKHPDIYTVFESLADLYLKKSIDYDKIHNNQQSVIFKEQASEYLNIAMKTLRDHFPQDSGHFKRIENKIKKLRAHPPALALKT